MPQLGSSLRLDSSSSRLLTTALALIPVATTNSFTWNGSIWTKEVFIFNEHNLRFSSQYNVEPPNDDIGGITNSYIFYFNRILNPPSYQDKWVSATIIYQFLNDEDNYGYYPIINDALNSFYYPTDLTYSPAGVSVSMLPTSFNGLSITNVS